MYRQKVHKNLIYKNFMRFYYEWYKKCNIKSTLFYMV